MFILWIKNYKQIQSVFIYIIFNKHSIKYASRNSYSSDEKQDWVS